MTRNEVITVAQKLCESLQLTLDYLYALEESDGNSPTFSEVRAHVMGSLLIDDGKSLVERLEALQADSVCTLSPDLTPPPWDWVVALWTRDKGPRIAIHRDIDSDETTDATADDIALMRDAPQLLIALRSLYDEQNGPPLIRHKDRWQSAMDDAISLLRKHNG